MYPLLRPNYITLGVTTKMTTTDPRREHETHQRNTKYLEFLLAQAMKRSASAIVDRCEHGGNTDDMEVAKIWNACMDDVHRTSGIHRYLHWSENSEISTVIL